MPAIGPNISSTVHLYGTDCSYLTFLQKNSISKTCQTIDYLRSIKWVIQ